jgi:hypothetical protein
VFARPASPHSTSFRYEGHYASDTDSQTRTWNCLCNPKRSRSGAIVKLDLTDGGEAASIKQYELPRLGVPGRLEAAEIEPGRGGPAAKRPGVPLDIVQSRIRISVKQDPDETPFDIIYP